MRHKNGWDQVVFMAMVCLGALWTFNAFGAVTYDFRQISHSDFNNAADGEVTGTGIIDGVKSRVELKKGYMPGSYIISRNDTQMVFIVDPVNKSFREINAAKIASAFGSSKIEIANLKTNYTRLNDTPTVAGLPTEHHRITLSYDITVMFGNLPLRQSVVTTIDKWVTKAFGELMDPALTRGAIATGNEDIDQLIEAEVSRVKGFPLRQVTSVQTTSSDAGQNRGSKLQLKPTRRRLSELLITRISSIIAQPALFEVPASFAKVDSSTQDGPVVQMLSMQP